MKVIEEEGFSSFVKYLSKTRYYRRCSIEQVQKAVKQIENDLILIKLCAGNDIYNFTDRNELAKIKNETNSGGLLYQLNNQNNGRIRESIDYYISFLGSKYHPHAKCDIRTIHTADSATDATDKKIPLKNGSGAIGNKTAKPKITLREGGKLQVRDSETYIRNPKAREECIKAYNSEYKCVVCGMNFVETYGEIGKEFIEVHHLFPISQTNGVHEIDPAKDLIPLCSNCHSMIHRLEDPSDWQSLKQFFESSRNA